MASDTTHTTTNPSKGTHTTTKTGGNSALAFIVGALVVAVLVLAYFMFAAGESSDDLTVTVEGAGAAVESVGSAADGVAGAVEGAADAVEGAAADATNN